MAFEDACLVALLLVSLSCAHVSFPQGKTGPQSSGYGRNLNSLFAKDNTPYPRAPYDNPPYTSDDSHEGIPFTFSDANPSRHLSRPIYRHGDDDDQRFLPMKSTDDRSYYRMKDHPRNYYPNGDDDDKWGHSMKDDDDHQKDYLMDHDDHQKDYAMKDHDDHWSYGRKDHHSPGLNHGHDRHNYKMNSNGYTYYYGINHHHTTRPDGLKDDHHYVMDHDDDHSRRYDHQKYNGMKDHDDDHSRVYGVKDDHQKYDGMNRRPDGMNDDAKRKYGGMKDHDDRRGPYLSKEVAVQKGTNTKGNSGGTSFVNYATVTVDYGRTEGRQDGSYGVGLSRFK